eukprot:2063450-Rhodomonas_salina.2
MSCFARSQVFPSQERTAKWEIHISPRLEQYAYLISTGFSGFGFAFVLYSLCVKRVWRARLVTGCIVSCQVRCCANVWCAVCGTRCAVRS